MAQSQEFADYQITRSQNTVNKIWLLVLAGAITAGVAIIGWFGNGVITGDKTTGMLSVQIQQLVESNKIFAEQNRGQEQLLRNMLEKQAEFPTRREFQTFTEQIDRRFSSLSEQTNNLSSRIINLESVVHFLQQQQTLADQQRSGSRR
jgi:hypothetical protein